MSLGFLSKVALARHPWQPPACSARRITDTSEKRMISLHWGQRHRNFPVRGSIGYDITRLLTPPMAGQLDRSPHAPSFAVLPIAYQFASGWERDVRPIGDREKGPFCGGPQGLRFHMKTERCSETKARSSEDHSIFTSPARMAHSMAWVRSRTWSLEKTLLMWFFTVFSLMKSRLAISLLPRPSAISVSTSSSRGVR
jgi:hypothetical protein